MSVTVTITPGPLGPLPATGEPDGAGAVISFEGVVRPLEDGRPIDALEYDAYVPMAEQLLEALGKELLGEFGLIAMEIEHSVGSIAPGECAFRLRVAAEHRPEALEAMGIFITRMKRDVPIFKRPVWTP